MANNKTNPPILNAAASKTARQAAKRGAEAAAASGAPGKIRIVGGLWKRTPLQVVDAPGLRPTPDRVRENLFNWLGPSVRGTRCLDLFAGTGALGLEALSRGAAHVHFNEPNAQAAAAIRGLLERLQKPPGADWQITRQDGLQVLAQAGSGAAAGFNLVFLDPPFHQNWLSRILPPLLPLLAPGARLYIEAEEAVAHPALELLKSGQAGVVHYHLFQFKPESPPPPLH